jgi:adenylate cyclase
MKAKAFLRKAFDWEQGYSRLKLGTGLVLFAFLLTHLVNHALALISLDTAEAGAIWFKLLWRNPAGSTLLYASFLLHPLLGLFNWIRRGHYRGIAWQGWAQLLLGLCIPGLMALHVFGTRGVNANFGVNDSYAFVLASLHVASPLLGLMQNLLILIAWAHGCIGMYYWLRIKPFFERAWPFLYAGALLLPALAMLGYLSGGRAVAFLLRDPDWAARFQAGINWPGEQAFDYVYRAADISYLVMAGLLFAGLAARGLMGLLARRHGVIRISYPDGRVWRGQAGRHSVLEASRALGYPHAAVCGGQGRCSTCRIRVIAPALENGEPDLPPPGDVERRVLARIGAPPGVRLACQLKPGRDIGVVPLLQSDAPPRAAYSADFRMNGMATGTERRIAILFADLRGFTRLADGKLPFDVVYLLNQYFKAMGEAVEQSGGRLDKFIGDGVMALFGLESGAHAGSRQALAAAEKMRGALIGLNDSVGQIGRASCRERVS